MRAWVVVVALGVAGCAPTVTAEKPCYVESTRFALDDPQVAIFMTVSNSAPSCDVLLSRGVGEAPGTITQQPGHGSVSAVSIDTGLNVRGVGQAAGFPISGKQSVLAKGASYKPETGYIGKDEFTFTLPAYRSAFRVLVTVVPVAAIGG